MYAHNVGQCCGYRLSEERVARGIKPTSCSAPVHDCPSQSTHEVGSTSSLFPPYPRRKL
jgi:hypothetical protein